MSKKSTVYSAIEYIHRYNLTVCDVTPEKQIRGSYRVTFYCDYYDGMPYGEVVAYSTSKTIRRDRDMIRENFPEARWFDF
jgi:hypothetical protein